MQTCEAIAASGMLRVHLERLINHLDDTSLLATLKLMICETRGAIHKQRALIALERLGGGNTAGRLDQLRDIARMQDELVAAYASVTDTQLNVAPGKVTARLPVGQVKVS